MNSPIELSEVDVRTAKTAVDAGAYFLDVRETKEFEAGHAVGATSIPLSVLGERLEEIPKDQDIYIICKSGGRSGQATNALNALGYHVSNILGGSLEWRAEGLPFETDNGSEATVI